MAEITSYAHLVAHYCPNLPKLIFRRAFISAARHYFTQTQAWEEVIKVSLVAAKQRYALDTLADDAEIDTIIDVYSDTGNLTGLTGRPFAMGQDAPRSYYANAKRTVGFYPIPKEAGVVYVQSCVKPVLEADTIDDDVFSDNAEGILAGAVYELKMMPNTDWYDPQGALYYKAERDRCIDEKRIEIATHYANHSLIMTYPNIL
ncbi:hypothetical protein [Bowmanella sp. JS7-9]|uniref:Uncharacterized protein n=1 Tax=Pseudobowmanella zhangzhouensis TaxID=1537679 RepID=A0ABW1XLJ3_9ALTE|nr:hypothetical protein [Bowmanella sp. JS7-9]TBX21923.1 hypothetical protein TK45_10570 [Bowmanella sp. JS7-9]